MEKKIGDRIKELRQKANLTQAELAEKMGFTSQTVSNWESGTREPDISALATLSQIFNVSLDYLLLGKEDDNITLDDMDAEKRLSWIIKRDDLENFKKYSYQDSAYLFGRTEEYTPRTHYGYNYRFKVTSLNIPTWKEIIDHKAYKIFNLALDEMLKKNTTIKCWLAFTVIDCLDDFVKALIDNDREDALEALGVKFFAIGENDPRQNPMLLGPSAYIGDYKAYFIKNETLKYFFEMKDKAPKSYKYITTLSLKETTAESRAQDPKATRTSYVVTFLEWRILQYALEFKDMELVKNIMSVFKKAKEDLKQLLQNANDGGWRRAYCLTNETYVFQNNNGYSSGPLPISARVFNYSSDLLRDLIHCGNLELAKEMIEENKDFNQSCAKQMRSQNGGDAPTAYIMTEKEIERMLKLESPDVSEEEKTLIRSVNERIIKRDYVANLDDLKLAEKILNENYWNYYEFAYDSVSKNDVKELFKLLVDNEFNDLAQGLLIGPSNYVNFLKGCWRLFNLTKEYSEYKEHKKFIERQNKIDLKQDPSLRMVNIEDEASKLGGNRIISLIKAEKVKILDSIKARLEAAKKAKEEAAEKAKIVKGLTREYFEGLLQKGEKEMFIIKLCALFDAILKFDYHLEGEDFSERMNKYFIQMNECAPKSRDKDDGWGYMVLDQEYEDEVVIPEQQRIKHLSDILNRLRIQRNNIAHSESKPVKELSDNELNECLDHILPKK